MYKGKLGHVKELLLAFQELRRASNEMNSFALILRTQTGGKENKLARTLCIRTIHDLEDRGEIYSRRAYYFRSLAHEHLKKVYRFYDTVHNVNEKYFDDIEKMP